MDQTIKEQWVAELRSGNLLQGVGFLHQGDMYCCLGVLCKIAEEQGATASNENHYNPGVISYDGDSYSLPYPVREWAGLSLIELPTVEVPLPSIGKEETLASLNDSGLSFNQIADVIEYIL